MLGKAVPLTFQADCQVEAIKDQARIFCAHFSNASLASYAYLESDVPSLRTPMLVLAEAQSIPRSESLRSQQCYRIGNASLGRLLPMTTCIAIPLSSRERELASRSMKARSMKKMIFEDTENAMREILFN